MQVCTGVGNILAKRPPAGLGGVCLCDIVRQTEEEREERAEGGLYQGDKRVGRVAATSNVRGTKWNGAKNQSRECHHPLSSTRRVECAFSTSTSRRGCRGGQCTGKATRRWSRGRCRRRGESSLGTGAWGQQRGAPATRLWGGGVSAKFGSAVRSLSSGSKSPVQAPTRSAQTRLPSTHSSGWSSATGPCGGRGT